jgi:hypothetical protein
VISSVFGRKAAAIWRTLNPDEALPRGKLRKTPVFEKSNAGKSLNYLLI